MSEARRHRPEAYARSAGSARLFAALGDEMRLNVVSRLCRGGPLSIARLTSGSSVTRQAITKHLRVREKAGLVQCTRRGRESIWQLDPRRLNEVRDHLEQMSRQWDDALERLPATVEDAR